MSYCAYLVLTGFLNNHTDKVQEGLGVFIECITALVRQGGDTCEKMIQNLKIRLMCGKVTHKNLIDNSPSIS